MKILLLDNAPLDVGCSYRDDRVKSTQVTENDFLSEAGFCALHTRMYVCV